jgi:hypothetical protein
MIYVIILFLVVWAAVERSMRHSVEHNVTERDATIRTMRKELASEREANLIHRGTIAELRFQIRSSSDFAIKLEDIRCYNSDEAKLARRLAK